MNNNQAITNAIDCLSKYYGSTEFSFRALNKPEPKLDEFRHGSLKDPEIQGWMLEQWERGRGVYYVPQKTNGKGTKNSDVVEIKTVFVDLDGAPIEPVMNCGSPPDMKVISSEGRWHCYWKVSDCDKKTFTETQKALVRKFGGDEKCVNPGRLLLVPCTPNLKRDQPFYSRAEVCSNGNAALQISEFINRMSLDTKKTPEKAQVSTGKVPVGKRNGHLCSRAGFFKNFVKSRDELSDLLRGVNSRELEVPLNGTDDPGELEKIINDYWFNKEGRTFKDSKTSTLPVEPPKIYNWRGIENMVIEPTRWIVDELIPAGLAIAAGRPKSGKSWFLMSLAKAIAEGGTALGRFKCKQGRVLFLSLEDYLSTTKERLAVLGGCKSPQMVDVAYDWAPISETEDPSGAVGQIEAWLDAHDDAAAVFIDTFTRLRPRGWGKELDYERDTRHIGFLQRLARDRNVAIVLVLHTRKDPPSGTTGASNVFDNILGSTGITGAADLNIVLQRSHREDKATLYISGRKVREEVSAALSVDRSTWEWKWLGDQSDVDRKAQYQQILDVLKLGEVYLLPDLVTVTGLSRATVYRQVGKMVEEGLLEKLVKGYRVPDKFRN